MSRLPALRLAAFLLLPLAAWPGLGYDSIRLPLAPLRRSTAMTIVVLRSRPLPGDEATVTVEDPIVEWGMQRTQIARQISALTSPLHPEGETFHHEQIDSLAELMAALEERIISTPATGLAGLRTQLQVASEIARESSFETWMETLLQVIAVGIERVAAPMHLNGPH